MKTETRRVLELFKDGNVHSSREIAETVFNELEMEFTLTLNCMTRLATKWGYLERMGLVVCPTDNRKVMQYRITRTGLDVLAKPIHQSYRGRGVAKRNTVGRLITFDPESRDGEYYAYKPAPAIRVSTYRDGCASSERI